MSKTLEYRKIILIGYFVDAPKGPPLLNREGLPASQHEQPGRLKIAFWIPGKFPFQRCAGATEVVNVFPFEKQALRDGAIFEHVQEFPFERMPTIEEMRCRLMPVWEALVVQHLGHLPNAPPRDMKPKLSIQFTAVEEETHEA